MMVELISSANAIFAFLYQQFVSSSIVFAGVLGVYVLIKRTSLYWLYYVWFLVLARLAVPPGVVPPLSVQGVLNALGGNDSSPTSHLSNGNDGLLPALEILAPAAGSAAPSAGWLQTGLAGAWVIGVSIMLIRYGLRRRARRRIIRNAEPVTDKRIMRQVNRWRATLGIRRTVGVIVGEQSSAPFTAGVIKPVIYLPRALSVAGDRAALEACIGHECVHIKRFDDLWLQIEWALKIVYFFHPAVWFCCHRIDRHREQICDHEAVNQGRVSRAAYAAGLLESVAQTAAAGRQPPIQPSFGTQYKIIRERLTLIKESKTMNRSHRKFVPLITAVAAVLVLPMTSFSTPAAAPTGQLSSVLDHLVAPVREGRISSRYGVNVLPMGPGKGGERFHRGIDIASAKDTPIYAVSDGRVKVAVEDFQNSDKPAYGKYVQIEHSAGIQSVYSHLNTLLVKPGQTVSAGQQIGNVGNTGRATGPHLHMELYVDGIAVDPEQYIEFAL